MLSRKLAHCTLLSLVLLQLLAFGSTPVVAQENDPSLEDFMMGFYANDGTLIQPFTVSNQKNFIFIPKKMGSESAPIIYETMYIWIFNFINTTEPVVKKLNYTIYEPAEVTEYQINPITNQPEEVTTVQYVDEVDNGTLKLTINPSPEDPPMAVRRWNLATSTITRRIVIQYLNVEIEFFYRTHFGQLTQLVTNAYLNTTAIIFIVLTFIFGFLAMTYSKKFLDRVIYAYQPSGTMLLVIGAAITFLVLGLPTLAQTPEADLIWLYVQTFPAFLLLPVVGFYQFLLAASTFNLERVDTFGYVLYRMGGDRTRALDFRPLSVYEKEIRGMNTYCWLNLATSGDGFFGLVRRFFGRHITIEGDLYGSIAFECPNPQFKHMTVVDLDSFRFAPSSDYQQWLATPPTIRFAPWIGLGLIVFGIFSFGVDMLLATGLVILGLVLIGIWATHTMRLVKQAVGPGRISFKSLDIDPFRLMFDEEYMRGIEKNYRELQRQVAHMKVNFIKESNELASDLTQDALFELSAGDAHVPRIISAERSARILFRHNLDTKGLNLPPEHEKITKELLEEMKNRKYDTEETEEDASTEE